MDNYSMAIQIAKKVKEVGGIAYLLVDMLEILF